MTDNNTECHKTMEAHPQDVRSSPHDISGAAWSSAGIQSSMLSDWLQNRRINLPTVIAYQLAADAGQTGILYPVPKGGQQYRWKNFDSQAKPKYKWLDGKPDAARFYHAPGFADAVQANAGACWLVSGEADVWAMHAAGIEHVLSVGFSESTVPVNLSEDLQAFGITTLYIAPDRDEAGDMWARKIMGRLLNSGIELDVRRLPDYLGEKADVGRAWQQYSRDGWPFERWLLGLPRYEIAPELIDTPRIKQEGDIPAGYRQLISDALGVKHFGDTGYSQAVICPFHDDADPSAYVHELYGLKCFACGRWFTWTKTGVQMGLGSLGEYLHAGQHNAEETPIQLCTETREAFIRHGLTSVARLLDACYQADVQPGSIWTIPALTAAVQVFGYSEGTVRRAFNSFQKCPLLFCLYQEEGDKPAKKCGKGRRPVKYRVPHPDELAHAMKVPVYPRHYDSMPVNGLTDDLQYRVYVYAARPSRQPGNYSRRDLTERIGLTPRTGRRYDKLANLDVTPRYEEELLTENDVMFLPEVRKNYYTWLRTASGRTFAPTRAGGEWAMKTGEQVFLVKRLTNHYQAKQGVGES